MSLGPAGDDFTGTTTPASFKYPRIVDDKYVEQKVTVGDSVTPRALQITESYQMECLSNKYATLSCKLPPAKMYLGLERLKALEVENKELVWECVGYSQKFRDMPWFLTGPYQERLAISNDPVIMEAPSKMFDDDDYVLGDGVKMGPHLENDGYNKIPKDALKWCREHNLLDMPGRGIAKENTIQYSGYKLFQKLYKASGWDFFPRQPNCVMAAHTFQESHPSSMSTGTNQERIVSIIGSDGMGVLCLGDVCTFTYGLAGFIKEGFLNDPYTEANPPAGFTSGTDGMENLCSFGTIVTLYFRARVLDMQNIEDLIQEKTSAFDPLTTYHSALISQEEYADDWHDHIEQGVVTVRPRAVTANDINKLINQDNLELVDRYIASGQTTKPPFRGSPEEDTT
ncbi:TPA_asm: hypothetical protein 2 [Varicolored abalone xenomavirus]|nr:TPA_asm: hypothetical protein 2 [Varicolored abalone xenomavirus]